MTVTVVGRSWLRPEMGLLMRSDPLAVIMILDIVILLIAADMGGISTG